MTDVDFTSKDLARIIYHIDENAKEKSKIDWKSRYDKLLKEIGDCINVNTYSKADDKERIEKLSDEDEQLKWKVKVIQQQVHKDEVDEKSDEEDWDKDD